jgi:hypothetical protein
VVINLTFIAKGPQDGVPAPLPQPAELPSVGLACNPDAAPAAPEKVRIESQRFNRVKNITTVIVAFDNPTTSNTGCITAYTVSVRNRQGMSLSAKLSLSFPTANPLRYESYREPGERYTIS